LVKGCTDKNKVISGFDTVEIIIHGNKHNIDILDAKLINYKVKGLAGLIQYTIRGDTSGAYYYVINATNVKEVAEVIQQYANTKKPGYNQYGTWYPEFCNKLTPQQDDKTEHRTAMHGMSFRGGSRRKSRLNKRRSNRRYRR